MSRYELDADTREILLLLWGADAVIEQHRPRRVRSGETRYALLPRPAGVRALVPTDPRVVATAVLRNYLTPTSWRGRVRAAALGTSARLGLLRLWPHSSLVQPGPGASGLIHHLSRFFANDLVAGVYLGPPRVNRKPVLQLVTTDGLVVAYVKVGTTDFTKRRVSNEIAALETLQRVQLRSLTVPEPLVNGDWQGRTFLVLAPVTTRSDTMTTPGARVEAMAELSHAFGVETAPMMEAAWWKQMEDTLASCPSEEDSHLRSIAAQVADTCGDWHLELGAAHGDWTPWNMATVNGRAVVWDWERFRRSVPIGWDGVHFAIESNRHAGMSTSDAVRRVIPDIAAVVNECGPTPNDGHLVMATYLLDLGQRYLQDARITGVAPRGPVSEWLLPPLTEVLSQLRERIRR